MERIGIIGSGNMGRTLGVRLAQLGYEVFFGARNGEQAEAASRLAGDGSQAGSLDQAAMFGDVLVWTIRESCPANALQNPSSLDGKVIIDLNNRDYAVEAKNGVWFQQAIAETLQVSAPSARIVKAFNTVAMESFATEPDQLRAAGAQTFIAGYDADAKQRVAVIARALGFEPVDLGDVPAAFRAAEALGDIIRILMIDGKLGATAHLRVISLPEPTLQGIGERNESKYA